MIFPLATWLTVTPSTVTFFCVAGNAADLARVGSGDGPGSHNLVLLTDEVVHLEAQIRKNGKELAGDGPVSFRTDGRAGKMRIVESVARSDELADNIEAAFVPDFLVQAADHGFGIGGHSGRSPK